MNREPLLPEWLIFLLLGIMFCVCIGSSIYAVRVLLPQLLQMK